MAWPRQHGRISVLKLLTAMGLTVFMLSRAYAQAAPAAPTAKGAADFSALLKQGFDLHQHAQFAEAIPVLQRARALQPGDYFVNLLLGIDLLRTGKASEAIPRLQLAAKARPAEEFPEDYLGEAQAALGHAALAAEAYQRAVLRGHDSEQSLEAWAGFALERFRQIGETLRASQAGVAVARRLQEAGKTGVPISAARCNAEIPTLERKFSLRQDVLDAQAAYDLSLCYATVAGDAASRLKNHAEDLAAVHRLRGDILLRLTGDGDAAKAEYEQAIAVRPGDPALLERLAEAELSTGEIDGAKRSAQAALNADPARRAALRTLASIAMSQRDYEAAMPLLQQLAKQTPQDRTVAVQLGTVLAQTGHWQQAQPLLATDLTAGYPDEKGALHALLAKALRRLNRSAEAETVEAEARRLSDAYQAHVPNGAEESGASGKPDAQHEF